MGFADIFLNVFLSGVYLLLLLICILVGSVVIYNFIMLILPIAERRFRRMMVERIRANQEHLQALNDLRANVYIGANMPFRYVRAFAQDLYLFIVSMPLQMQIYFGILLYHFGSVALSGPNWFQKAFRRMNGMNLDDDDPEREVINNVSDLVQVVSDSMSEISVSTPEIGISQNADDVGFERDDIMSILIYYIEKEQQRNFVAWVRLYRERRMREIPSHALRAIQQFDSSMQILYRSHGLEQSFWQSLFRKPKLHATAWPHVRNAAISSAHIFHMQMAETPDLHFDTVMIAIICMVCVTYIPVMPLWFMVYCLFRYQMVSNIFKIIACVVTAILMYVVIIKMYVFAGTGANLPQIFFFLLLLLTPVFGVDITISSSLGFFTVSTVLKDEELVVAIVLVTSVAVMGLLAATYAFIRVIVVKASMEIDDLERGAKKFLSKFH